MLDAAAWERSRQLVECVPDLEWVLPADRPPHVTLMHANVLSLEAVVIDGVLDGLAAVVGEGLIFKGLDLFGDRFLFWDIEMQSWLFRAHDVAAEQLRRQLNPDSVARALEEGCTLTEQERENVQRFGHPLVGDLYRPHVTIAWDEDIEGLDLAPMLPFTSLFRSSVTAIAFALIGHNGVVEEILSSRTTEGLRELRGE